MPYSLVGAPTIGFDLVRLPAGPQVARVLRTALGAGAAELDLLAGRHPGDRVRGEWHAACRRATEAPQAPETLSTLIPRAGEALAEASHGETALLRRLETGTLGDARALERLLRHELLDRTWLHSGPMAVQDPRASLAADVLVDAALAAFWRGTVPDELARAMVGPFLAAGVAVDEHGPTGLPAVDDRLALLADVDAELRDTWRRVVDEQRLHTAEWAPAMHQATWALSLTERLHPACDAQLAAVATFRRAGFTERDAAYGVWNAVAGMVQASAVGDLLPEPEADVLLRAWRAVHGVG